MEIVAIIATGAVLGTAAMISTEFGKVIPHYGLFMLHISTFSKSAGFQGLGNGFFATKHPTGLNQPGRLYEDEASVKDLRLPKIGFIEKPMPRSMAYDHVSQRRANSRIEYECSTTQSSTGTQEEERIITTLC
jgi:hypothetical protein